MRDIQNRADLEFLMKEFYNKMLVDEKVGYIFTAIAKLDLDHHLPLLVDFWMNSLFHVGGYKNNVTQIHRDLNAKETLTPEHFQQWLYLFNETVDNHYQGEMVEKMKLRANQIAMTIRAKLGHYS